MQRRQARHRQTGRLRIGDVVRNGGDKVYWRVNTLGPGTDRQQPDHPSPDRRRAGRTSRRLHYSGEVPTGRGPARRLGQGALDLAAIERDRRDPDGHLAGAGGSAHDPADGEALGLTRLHRDRVHLKRWRVHGHTTVIANGPALVAA